MNNITLRQEVEQLCDASENLTHDEVQALQQRCVDGEELPFFRDQIRRFEEGACHRCGWEGWFKWRFLGRHKHEECGWEGYCSPWRYSVRQIRASIGWGWELGGEALGGTRASQPIEYLIGFFLLAVGFVAGFAVRLPFSLAFAVIQVVAYMYRPHVDRKPRRLAFGVLAGIMGAVLLAVLAGGGIVWGVSKVQMDAVDLPSLPRSKGAGVDVWDHWVEFGLPLSDETAQSMGAEPAGSNLWHAWSGPGDYREEVDIHLTAKGNVQKVKLKARRPVGMSQELLLRSSHLATQDWWGEGTSSATATEDGCTRWAESYKRQAKDLRIEANLCVKSGYETSSLTFYLQ